ncbi:MAG: hypothetical protein QOI48_3897 [Solirubrobacteraceae bacterium]|jgi:hypothetical protein|nr:hypothetical protein [Mycobacterium sp.]MDX6708051.1 hypothetical protein [Solirubrobacteraceae bacterium]
MIRGGAGMSAAVRDLALCVGEAGGLLEGAGQAGERDEVQALQLQGDAVSGLVGLAFGDAGLADV